jgi:hypothetical protein
MSGIYALYSETAQHAKQVSSVTRPLYAAGVRDIPTQQRIQLPRDVDVQRIAWHLETKVHTVTAVLACSAVHDNLCKVIL